MEQRVLVDEAKQIITDLDLVAILSHYGETRLVGSVALEMVVKRDIDLHVLLETDDIKEAADKICTELKENHGVEEINVYYDRSKVGVKLTIHDYPGQTGNWMIEIWITDWIENTDFAFTELLQRTLTHEQRETIMRIKEDFYYQGFLKDELRSLIYKAVLEDGVKTSQELLNWKTRMFQGNNGKTNALF